MTPFITTQYLLGRKGTRMRLRKGEVVTLAAFEFKGMLKYNTIIHADTPFKDYDVKYRVRITPKEGKIH